MPSKYKTEFLDKISSDKKCSCCQMYSIETNKPDTSFWGCITGKQKWRDYFHIPNEAVSNPWSYSSNLRYNETKFDLHKTSEVVLTSACPSSESTNKLWNQLIDKGVKLVTDGVSKTKRTSVHCNENTTYINSPHDYKVEVPKENIERNNKITSNNYENENVQSDKSKSFDRETLYTTSDEVINSEYDIVTRVQEYQYTNKLQCERPYENVCTSITQNSNKIVDNEIPTKLFPEKEHCCSKSLLPTASNSFTLEINTKPNTSSPNSRLSTDYSGRTTIIQNNCNDNLMENKSFIDIENCPYPNNVAESKHENDNIEEYTSSLINEMGNILKTRRCVDLFCGCLGDSSCPIRSEYNIHNHAKPCYSRTNVEKPNKNIFLLPCGMSVHMDHVDTTKLDKKIQKINTSQEPIKQTRNSHPEMHPAHSDCYNTQGNLQKIRNENSFTKHLDVSGDFPSHDVESQYGEWDRSNNIANTKDYDPYQFIDDQTSSRSSNSGVSQMNSISPSSNKLCFYPKPACENRFTFLSPGHNNESPDDVQNNEIFRINPKYRNSVNEHYRDVVNNSEDKTKLANQSSDNYVFSTLTSRDNNRASVLARESMLPVLQNGNMCNNDNQSSYNLFKKRAKIIPVSKYNKLYVHADDRQIITNTIRSNKINLEQDKIEENGNISIHTHASQRQESVSSSNHIHYQNSQKNIASNYGNVNNSFPKEHKLVSSSYVLLPVYEDSRTSTSQACNETEEIMLNESTFSNTISTAGEQCSNYPCDATIIEPFSHEGYAPIRCTSGQTDTRTDTVHINRLKLYNNENTSRSVASVPEYQQSRQAPKSNSLMTVSVNGQNFQVPSPIINPTKEQGLDKNKQIKDNSRKFKIPHLFAKKNKNATKPLFSETENDANNQNEHTTSISNKSERQFLSSITEEEEKDILRLKKPVNESKPRCFKGIVQKLSSITSITPSCKKSHLLAEYETTTPSYHSDGVSVSNDFVQTYERPEAEEILYHHEAELHSIHDEKLNYSTTPTVYFEVNEKIKNEPCAVTGEKYLKFSLSSWKGTCGRTKSIIKETVLQPRKQIIRKYLKFSAMGLKFQIYTAITVHEALFYFIRTELLHAASHIDVHQDIRTQIGHINNVEIAKILHNIKEYYPLNERIYITSNIQNSIRNYKDANSHIPSKCSINSESSSRKFINELNTNKNTGTYHYDINELHNTEKLNKFSESYNNICNQPLVKNATLTDNKNIPSSYTSNEVVKTELKRIPVPLRYEDVYHGGSKYSTANVKSGQIIIDQHKFYQGPVNEPSVTKQSKGITNKLKKYIKFPGNPSQTKSEDHGHNSLPYIYTNNNLISHVKNFSEISPDYENINSSSTAYKHQILESESTTTFVRPVRRGQAETNIIDSYLWKIPDIEGNFSSNKLFENEAQNVILISDDQSPNITDIGVQTTNVNPTEIVKTSSSSLSRQNGSALSLSTYLSHKNPTRLPECHNSLGGTYENPNLSTSQKTEIENNQTMRSNLLTRVHEEEQDMNIKISTELGPNGQQVLTIGMEKSKEQSLLRSKDLIVTELERQRTEMEEMKTAWKECAYRLDHLISNIHETDRKKNAKENCLLPQPQTTVSSVFKKDNVNTSTLISSSDSMFRCSVSEISFPNSFQNLLWKRSSDGVETYISSSIWNSNIPTSELHKILDQVKSTIAQKDDTDNLDTCRFKKLPNSSTNILDIDGHSSIQSSERGQYTNTLDTTKQKSNANKIKSQDDIYPSRIPFDTGIIQEYHQHKFSNKKAISPIVVKPNQNYNMSKLKFRNKKIGTVKDNLCQINKSNSKTFNMIGDGPTFKHKLVQVNLPSQTKNNQDQIKSHSRKKHLKSEVSPNTENHVSYNKNNKKSFGKQSYISNLCLIDHVSQEKETHITEQSNLHSSDKTNPMKFKTHSSSHKNKIPNNKKEFNYNQSPIYKCPESCCFYSDGRNGVVMRVRGGYDTPPNSIENIHRTSLVQETFSKEVINNNIKSCTAVQQEDHTKQDKTKYRFTFFNRSAFERKYQKKENTKRFPFLHNLMKKTYANHSSFSTSNHHEGDTNQRKNKNNNIQHCNSIIEHSFRKAERDENQSPININNNDKYHSKLNSLSESKNSNSLTFFAQSLKSKLNGRKKFIKRRQ